MFGVDTRSDLVHTYTARRHTHSHRIRHSRPAHPQDEVANTPLPPGRPLLDHPRPRQRHRRARTSSNTRARTHQQRPTTTPRVSAASPSPPPPHTPLLTPLRPRQGAIVSNPAATLNPEQYPIATTQWIESTAANGGAITYVSIAYTQTFAPTPDPWYTAGKGTIGLGTLTKHGKREVQAVETGIAGRIRV